MLLCYSHVNPLFNFLDKSCSTTSVGQAHEAKEDGDPSLRGMPQRGGCPSTNHPRISGLHIFNWTKNEWIPLRSRNNKLPIKSWRQRARARNKNWIVGLNCLRKICWWCPCCYIILLSPIKWILKIVISSKNIFP